MTTDDGRFSRTAGVIPHRVNGDRDTDRVVEAEEAGLGGGLDQAEEAQLGKTDEQIEQESANAAGRARTPKGK